MKLKSLIMFSAAALAFAACSNDEDVKMPVNDEGTKSIILTINGSETRAITPDDPYTEVTELTSLDIYFTNANSAVQASYRLTPTDADNWAAIEGAGLRFVGLDNVSAVYVVANSAEETLAKGAVLKTDFTTTLDKQGPAVEQNQVIFAGSDVDITPVQEEIIAGVPTYDGTPEAGDQVYTAEVKIRPILSRMEWGKIEIQESGLVERTIGDKKYMVEWSGWNPTISGIFQSNAYLTDNVFAPSVDDLFATPTNTNALVNGAWTAMTGYETTWTAYNAALAYTGYAEGTGYAAVLPVGYDGTASCVPFHFFVPFDTTSDAAEVEGSLTATPGWHFQLYYPEQTGYTVKVYNYDADTADHKGTEVDVNVDNDALAVMGDFMFPVREDHLAYANVYSLNEADAQVAYKPGKIYNANISIAPYNVTSGFKDVTDYNVIVKVSVADFDKVAVTPNFDKN